MDHAARLTPVLEAARRAAAAVDDEGSFPNDAVDALRASGLLGLTLPEGAGGLARGPVELVEVLSRLAGTCGSTAMVYLMHVASSMVVAAAPPTGDDDLLRRLAGGELLGTLAFSEKGSRSHFWAPVSEAIPEGDHEVRLKASKSWVTSAGHADLYVLSCLTPGHSTPTDTDVYAIPAGQPGWEVASSGWSGLGLRGNASAPMEADLTVSDDQRLGERGDGFRLMMEVVLPWFNVGNAAVSLGLARAALDAAIEHAGTSRFQHLDSSLADLPTIRARLAQAHLRLETVSAYVHETAARMAADDPYVMLAILGTKAAANDAALAVTEDAMRVCGGAAFSRHLPVERAFRDARAGHVMAPTADVLYDLYGRSLCGLDLF
jgi:alkylation response protein AidB-like acyl-CoA dehydrogenase